MPIQIRRTSVPNRVPTGLLPGQLAVEMASNPPKLWCGVPASIDPLQRRELGGGVPASLLGAQADLRGFRQAGNVNQMTFSASAIALRDAAGNSVVSNGTAGITCNIAVQGANGRDQAAAFANNNWIHFYWIFNPATSTLATVASLQQPPSFPQPLPAGFTHWTYIGPIRRSTAVAGLQRIRISGQTFFYVASYGDFTGAGGVQFLASGQSMPSDYSVMDVSIANFVPPNADDFTILTQISGGITIGGEIFWLMETGVIYIAAYAAPWTWANVQFVLPYVSPTIQYATTYEAELFGYLNSYTVPNGAT